MKITDERLAEMVGAGVPCVPAQPGEIAAVVQELRALRAASITPPAPERSKEEVRDILQAVAHIGVDFGYGPYVLEEKFIKAAQELLEASPAPLPVGVTDSWQPIETAPKDGTEVLVTGPLYNDSAKGRYRTIAAFKEDGWYENQAAYPEENLLWEPTHWTPLPSLLAIPAKPREQG